MKKNTRSFIRKSLCGASALAIASSMMVVPAFADPGGQTMATTDSSLNTGNNSPYVLCSAFAAAEPGPEILGLTNMGWRSTDGTIGELTWKNPAFYIWGTSRNSNPNPFYWNSVVEYAANNGTTTPSRPLSIIAAYSRAGGGPSGAMHTYADASDNEKLVWETEPDIILGTTLSGKSVDYTGSEYAGAVSAVTGDTSYSPVGVGFNISYNSNILSSMYDLAAAGDKVAADNPTKKLRYGNATNIAKELEEYYRGSQGYVLKQLAKDGKEKKKFVVVRAYDSATDTWTAAKTGAVAGATSSERVVETLQNVATNIADGVGDATETASLTTAQIRNADCILIGSTAKLPEGQSESGLVSQLQSSGLISKTYWDGQANSEGHPGATFGTSHNSPENIQNYGRILGFAYPEYLDQDDMICYYYDHFYHIDDDQLETVIDEAMDGVRNYDATGSDLTQWTTRDASTYNSEDVQDILKEGLAYVKANESSLDDTLKVSDNYGTVATDTIGDGSISSISAKTYTGKAIKPSVTVRLNGRTLSSSNYTVSYSHNKNVGTATVTVRGTGDYYGHLTKTFTINPKGTSLSKVAAQKKGFKATWKKQNKQTDGFQVRYSTKSSMKSAKTKKVSGKNKTSTTVKSLKKGKKYYVQVRSYKKASGKTYYSSWSGKKSVKTK